MRFRSDINGLRAWAVAAVVLYHFHVPGFQGGFIGVDVFFVISGFLMTGIIHSGLIEGRFSIWQFYFSRASRIVPALTAMCLVLVAIGWLMLTSVDYRLLGVHVASGSTFWSNFKFLSESGYFDSESHSKWLLHTWSLAVEWQFYMLLPLALLLLWQWQFSRARVLLFMTMAFLASLLLSIYFTEAKPRAAFYLLPTRAWEMLAGGIVYLLPRNQKLESASTAGFGVALLLASMIFVGPGDPWPGWRALVPILGAMLLIYSRQDGAVLTSSPAIQRLGNASYSVYLWHWPIMVAMGYLALARDPRAVSLGILFSLILGWLSFVYIEAPSRRFLAKLPGIKALSVLSFFWLIAVVSGGVIYWNNGYPERNPTEIEAIAKESHNANVRNDKCMAFEGVQTVPCTRGGLDIKAILIGDSHANAVAIALAHALPDANVGFVEWTYAGCPAVLGAQSRVGVFGAKHRCADHNQWLIDQLMSTPSAVPAIILTRASVYIMGYNESGERSINEPLIYFLDRPNATGLELYRIYSERLIDFACKLTTKRAVYMVRPTPEMAVNVPSMVARGLMAERVTGMTTKPVSVSTEEILKRHQVVLAAQDEAVRRCGVVLLDPTPYLCKGGRCEGTRDGHVLYADDDHLSDFGGRLLAPMFSPVFDR